MGKLFEELKQLKAEYDKKLQQEGEAAVKDAFNDLFTTYPEVRTVAWTQYTPYWNDGDVCHFRVHEFDVSLGTDETLKDQITEKKRLVKEAAEKSLFKVAAMLQQEVEELECTLQDQDNEEYSYGESLYALKKSKDPRQVALAKAVTDLQKELPDEVLESVFGDHTKIVATRDGFKVKEYEHD